MKKSIIILLFILMFLNLFSAIGLADNNEPNEVNDDSIESNEPNEGNTPVEGESDEVENENSDDSNLESEDDTPVEGIIDDSSNESNSNPPEDDITNGSNKEPEGEDSIDELVEEVTPFIDTLTRKNAWTNKTVYLTFDDGPSWITEKILDLLKKENVKATFFVVGDDSDYGKSILKRISAEKHAIGNHTYSHNYDYIYKNKDNFFMDLNKNEKIIYEATGIRPKIVRLPGGSSNNMSRSKDGKNLMLEICNSLEQKGYSYFDWNASSGDAAVIPATPEQIIDNALQWISRHNDAVVLFHDSSAKANTLKAMPIIIEKLKFLGVQFEVLSENSPKVTFLKTNWKDNNSISQLQGRPPKPKHVIEKLKRLELQL